MKARLRWCAILMLALAVGGCANDDDEPDTPTAPSAPTAPTPTPRANLQPFGNFRWQDCISSTTPSCTFVAALRNVGSGCAIRVEGTIRFFSALGLQVGSSYRFVLPPQQIVAVGEQIPYFVPFISTLTAIQATDYTVSAVWIDTPCF